MMIKLIVSDFDGTLLPYGQAHVSTEAKFLIEKALDQKITFAVSSGRTYNELVALLPEFADRLYFISCDGAHYAKGGKNLYEKKIEASDLALFFDFGHKFGDFSFVLHGAQSNYCFGDIPSSAKVFEPLPVSRATEISEKIYKVTTYGREFKPSPYSGLRMHWDGGKELSAQYVNRFANKCVALSDLQMRLMLTKFDTACIGDSGNDVVMMKGAKHSYSVGNRCHELLCSVTSQVTTVEEALKDILSINMK